MERVRRVGLEKYIDQQLRPEQIADTAMTARLAPLDTLTKSSRELAEQYFEPAQMERRRQQQQNAGQPAAEPADRRDMRTPEQSQLMQAERGVFTDLAQQKILRAAYSDRQLNEVMVDFWFNHFNVFAGKGQVRAYLTEYERDVIRLQTIFGGKNPHPNFLVGGMACSINMDNQLTINQVSLAQLEGMIQRARDFVEKVYYPAFGHETRGRLVHLNRMAVLANMLLRVIQGFREGQDRWRTPG